ncbi:MAG TPA: transposase [Planctomycetes bacterium]|nr:transposase [Planctomycetota bacterium]
MARLARVVLPGVPHHVTQRGSRREEVFFSDEDREIYLEMVANAAEKYGVEFWAWCLMPNHVHFVVVPRDERSLARCFGRAHTEYSRWINFRTGWRGTLWQGRFASSAMDEPHAWHAVRYVERNPVRARMVRVAWSYEWSSAAYHVGIRTKDALIFRVPKEAQMAEDWRAYLQDESETALADLRRETRVGRPVGSAVFLAHLERRLDRTLIRGKPGRGQKEEARV